MSVGPRLAFLDAPRPPLPPLEFQDGGGVNASVLYSMSWMRFGLARAVLSPATFAVFGNIAWYVETRAASIAYTRRREKIKGEDRLGSRRPRGTGKSEAKQDQNLAVVPCARRRATLE